MMKTWKWPSCLMATWLILSLGSCEDWGRMDPPAGTDVYPRLEMMGEYTFDEGLDPQVIQTFAYDEGEIPELVEDEELGSQVLHLNGGYARVFNPLTAGKAQNGVSLTFWVKQPLLEADEETGIVPEGDLNGALFSFQNANATQRMFMTANGWLSYTGVDGTYEANNPETVETGMLDPTGTWHYVAVRVRDDGYDVYVDGKQRINETVPESTFDFNKIVQFMAGCDYIYIGEGSDTNTQEMWIDNIRVYRNQITSSEQNPGNIGGGDSGFTYPIATITAIGTADCTVAWWTAFSDYYTLQPGTTLHLEFTNHTSGAGNWNNWNLCVATEAERNADGYAEYFVIRSDLYGWGDASYNAGNIVGEGYDDWDKFRADMEGAHVTIDLVRNGATVEMTATATAADGTVYIERYHQECGDGTQNINAFLIADGSYLVMDTENTQYEDAVPLTATTVGTSDCTVAWWTAFSDYYTIAPNSSLDINFINHTSGAGNWNNWNICVATEAERNGDGYAEYFVMRSDLYGWGDSNYNAGNIVGEGYDDWDKFRVDMEGANVNIKVSRSGSTVEMVATATAADGTVYIERYHQECGDGTQNINAFLIADGSYLEIQNVSNVTKAFR